MTFYDELGLSPQASAEEIRESYRTLVRLLHPDQHQDEKLRRAAEIQLKRLNFIYSELSDPERRKRYDQGLSAPMSSAAPVQRRLVATPGVVAAALCAGALAGWFARGLDRPAPCAALPARSAVTSAPPPPAPSGREVTDRTPKARGRPPQPARARSSAQLGTPGTDTPEFPVPVDPSAAVDQHLAPGPPEPVGPVAPLALPPAAGPRFAGRWLYAPSKTAAQPASYPPEYIELTIAETGRRLRGSYRARYRVLDRAVSRSVAFEFEGETPGSSAARLLWSGPEGAWGEVWLELLSENALLVRWSATEPGRQLAVASGAAVLTRLREP